MISYQSAVVFFKVLQGRRLRPEILRGLAGFCWPSRGLMDGGPYLQLAAFYGHIAKASLAGLGPTIENVPKPAAVFHGRQFTQDSIGL